MNYQQNDWMNWLTTAEFQYNDKQHVATEKTLFKLNFGRYPWKGDLMVQTMIPRVEEFIKELQKSWEQAISTLEEAQKKMKNQFDKKRRSPQGLKPGDYMWLESKNIHSN